VPQHSVSKLIKRIIFEILIVKRTLIKQEKIPATKKGRDYFVLETDVENLPERKKTGRPKKINE
jgi:hypothetical protein